MIPGPLKTHGGKSYIAKDIVALLPPKETHWHYVEPYLGGGAVLLAKECEGYSEVVNDLDGELTNFWWVLQSPKLFAEFHRVVECVPFSEIEWNRAEPDSRFLSSVEQAVAFFVRCRQSLAGRQAGFASISRSRLRRGLNEQVSAWINAIDGLALVHARLRRCLILNRPALDMIASEDAPNTVFYLDPPYQHETRTTTGEYGTYEMTYADHVTLLQTLGGIKGRFLLSGYSSELYLWAQQTYGWKRHDFEVANSAAGGETKRRMTECVWSNER